MISRVPVGNYSNSQQSTVSKPIAFTHAHDKVGL
jgi:hypothetical protein